MKDRGRCDPTEVEAFLYCVGRMYVLGMVYRFRPHFLTRLSNVDGPF